MQYCAVCEPVYNPQPSLPFLDGNGQKLVKRAVQPPPRRVQDGGAGLRENLCFQALGSNRNPLDAEKAAARLQAMHPPADGLPIRGGSRPCLGQRGLLLRQARAVLFDQLAGQD